MKVIPTVHGWKPNKIREQTVGVIIHAMNEEIRGLPASHFLNDIGLSAHAFIHPTGVIELGQDDKKVAYHAGKSSWEGWTNLNYSFLGIEVLVDKEFVMRSPVGNDPYAKFKYVIDNMDWVMSKQLDAIVYLIKRWKQDYPDIEYIVGHADVSPDRKTDPGLMFPFDLVHKYL